MKCIYAPALLFAAGLAGAQLIGIDPSDLTPDQASRIESDLSTYQTSLTAQPEYTTFLNALSSALGSDAFASFTAGALDPGDIDPSDLTDLPDSILDYITSVGGEVQDIYTSDLAISATDAPISDGSVGGGSTFDLGGTTTAAETGSSAASRSAAASSAASSAASAAAAASSSLSSNIATPTDAPIALGAGMAFAGVIAGAALLL